jgi:hypothetical protein
LEAEMKSRSIKMLALIISVVLLAGCHKLEATTKVESNGSGELKMGVGFSAEERTNIEKQNKNNNVQDFCNTSQPPPNIKVTEEQRGDETWCITTTQFKDLEELRSLYEQRKGIRINRLEIADGKFYFDVDIDTLSETSDFSVLTDITWTVALPGAPIEHNADQADGNILTWTVTPKTDNVNLRAESEVPRRGFNFPPCGSAFIGLIAVLFHLHWRFNHQ